jgi:DNA-binding CsgD family transcriptional regulator
MTNAVHNILKLDSREWHDQISGVIAAQNTDKFPAVLVKALRSVVPFDNSVIFGYQNQEIPICLYNTFNPQQHVVFVADYQAGPYLLDPFFKVCNEKITPGLYRLRNIAPDRFYHSEYYHSYYRRTGLSEEIGFIISLPDENMLTISLMRAGTSPQFSDRDMAKLRRTEPVIHALVAHHWTNLATEHADIISSNNQDPAIGIHITSSFESFGKNILTPREREVVSMVLRGHSSDSIGQQFGISTGTVKIHRKNLYAKLDISSQSELFSLFISHLTNASNSASINISL